ncbi:MAG: argonaute/piwi family protein [Bacteroidota bacterium]|jgi:hypothetical protein
MKVRYIDEPVLQFGSGQHLCPRKGIFTFSPYDIDLVRPDKIKLGIIGKPDSVEVIIEWLDKCKSHIDEKKGKNPLPNLFTNFCGFNLESGFKCEVVFDESYIRKINNSEFDEITKKHDNLETRIEEVAGLYLNEIKYLTKNKNPDVILCVISEKLISFITEGESKVEKPGKETEQVEEQSDIASAFTEEIENEPDMQSKLEQNFRRYLKAKAMQYHIPIQMVRDRIANPSKEMQDPATIAWNFFTALYYKASGIPWALIRRDGHEATCYAGISFFKSRDRKTTQTSIAQIFNELGKGVILRGDEIVVRKDDLTPHLSEEQAFNLLDKSLKEYWDAIKIAPKRLVLHKTSNFNEAEIYGFKQAAKKYNINAVDLVSIQSSDIRLYRTSVYPPMRGTHLSLSEKHHVLYTRGSVPYYETYPGMYIPRPLSIRLFEHDESPNTICDEILALTKMNWNNTQFDRRNPITIDCARNVGHIMKYIEEEDNMELKYGFYM